MVAVQKPVVADNAVLDELLNAVCVGLQLSDEQYALAERRYAEVGAWITAPDSPLARFHSKIYAQGGMRIRTTVKPRESRGEEFDLDVVFEADATAVTPGVLYRLVADRLKAHPDYRARLELKNRCLRLKYPRAFHLDLLAARRAPGRRDGAIDVPDRELRDWHPSNPNGYAEWFERRCATSWGAIEARAQTPLPKPLPSHLLAPLRRAVQLTKRRRDNRFEDDTLAPRSIVVTTLAGTLYSGLNSTSAALFAILLGIEQQIAVADAAGGRVLVLNPTRSEEDFSERWNEDPKAYRAFRDFVREFRNDVQQLIVTRGIDELGEGINRLFGQSLGTRAVEAYVARVRRSKDSGELRYSGPALLLHQGAGRRSAPHTFHHSDGS